MKFKSVSFVFPIFNEAANIRDTMQRASRLAREISDDYEIVAVDDASTDGCGDIIDEIVLHDPHIRSIRLKENTKFGGALYKGLKNATKDVIVYTDADFPAKEEDIKKGLELLDGADIVTAYSLVIKDASLKRIMMSKVYNFLVELLFDLKIRDINSGLKIYRKEVFKNLELRSKSPFIDVEIFAEAARRSFRIQQFGLIFELRTHGKSMISRPAIVARTFWDMLIYRFSR